MEKRSLRVQRFSLPMEEIDFSGCDDCLERSASRFVPNSGSRAAFGVEASSAKLY